MTHQELAVKIRSAFTPTTVLTDILSVGIKSSFGVRVDGVEFFVQVVEAAVKMESADEAQ